MNTPTYQPVGHALVTLLLVLGIPAALGAQDAPADTVADTAQVQAPVEVDTTQILRAETIVSELTAIVDTILDLEQTLGGLNEQEMALLRVRATRYMKDIHERQSALLRLIPQIRDEGIPVGSLVREFQQFLTVESQVYARAIERQANRSDELRDRRADATLEELGQLEVSIRETEARLDTLLAGQMATLVGSDSVGLDVTQLWDALDRFITNRAEGEVGRLQLAVAERNRLREQVRLIGEEESTSDQAVALRTRLSAVDERVNGLVQSLRSLSDLLDQRGVDTAEYRQIVIEATGQVTGDVFNPSVLIGLIGDGLGRQWQSIKRNTPTVIASVLLLLTSTLAGRWIFALGWRVLQVTGVIKMHRLLADTLGHMVRPTGTIVGFIAGLSFMGINPAALLTGVGVAGVVVGLALQDSMANLAAGLFILIYRPYDLDDIVNAGGVVGTVKAMGLANTTVVTFDRRRMYVPNRKIWAETIENRSIEPIRRVDSEIKVGYDQDLNRVLAVVSDLLSTNDTVLSDPAPQLYVKQFGESWLDVAVWCYVPTSHWWDMTTALPGLLRDRFAEEGIDVPVPSREVVSRTDRKGTGAGPGAGAAADEGR